MSKQHPIRLIAGLGNPGDKYSKTRHNVGFWFLAGIQQQYGLTFTAEKKFHGQVASFMHNGEKVRVIAPLTFMNLSGNAVASIANFFQIPAQQILVIHDELDLPVGTNRLKFGGGHGGHNGLRDIIPKLGSKDFLRLRIGIGHPGNAKQVSNYVLSAPGKNDLIEIEQAIDNSVKLTTLLLDGDINRAVQQQNSKT